MDTKLTSVERLLPPGPLSGTKSLLTEQIHMHVDVHTCALTDLLKGKGRWGPGCHKEWSGGAHRTPRESCRNSWPGSEYPWSGVPGCCHSPGLAWGPSDRFVLQALGCSESDRKGPRSSSAPDHLSKTASFHSHACQEREETQDSFPLPSLKETGFWLHSGAERSGNSPLPFGSRGGLCQVLQPGGKGWEGGTHLTS